MKLTRYEQETIVNFNAEDPDAIVYTRDKTVMRQLDALVTEYPDIFKCIGETDIDKTYSMPKSRISYRKPRRISESKRQHTRKQMEIINRKVRTTRKTGGLLTAISRCYQASVSRRWLSLSAMLALRLQPHSFVQALLLLTRSSP